MEKTFENIDNEEHIEPNTGSNTEISEKNLSPNKRDNRNKKEQSVQQGIYTLYRNDDGFLKLKLSQSRNILFKQFLLNRSNLRCRK